MDNILLIFVCLSLGYFIKKIPNTPQNLHQGINIFVIYVALPAIILLLIPQMAWTWTTLVLLSVCSIVYLGGWVFFRSLSPIFKWDKKTYACLLLTGATCNASFVGFPLTELFYGEEGLKLAILVNQGASFTLMLFGVGTAVHYAEGQIDTKTTIRKIVFYPPFVAFVLALIFQFWEYPPAVTSVLKKVGSTLVPLALFSVGYQLKLSYKPKLFRDMGIGLTYKLLFAPLLIFVIQVFLLDKNDLSMQVSVIEAGMPPQVTASILASSYHLNPDLAQLITGLGILFSFMTTAIWYYMI